MKIYLNSHGDMDLLTQKDLWKQTAKIIDGWWIGPPTFRELSRDIRIAMIENTDTRQAVVALPFNEFSKGQGNLVYAKASGLDVHTLMVYWEGLGYPGSRLSILHEGLIKEVRERNPEYRLISNLRQWRPEYIIGKKKLKNTIKDDLDGICYEFQPLQDKQYMTQWIEATKYLFEYDKDIYVLLPPNHNTHKEDNNYLKDCVFVVTEFRRNLPTEILDSDRLVFVPANYDYSKTGIATVPEYNACNLHRGYYNGNTVTGVCRWIAKTR